MEQRVSPYQEDRVTRSRALWASLLVVAMSAGACSGTDSDPIVTSPSVSPSEPSSPAPDSPMRQVTLGLHLFAHGEIVEVIGGEERVVARWPSRIAPYQPPVETRHGFVGLARGRNRLDLWLVSERRARIARDVAQGFAVSAGATKVAYGLPRYESGGYHTRLIVATLPEGRSLESVAIKNYAQPIGFIGDRVLIFVGDALARASLWDPATGEMRPLQRYRAGATDATSRRALLFQGDGGCWDIGSWGDAFHRVRGRRCSLSRPAFSPQARWVAGIQGPEFGPRNRLDVFDVYKSGHTFRSLPIPGAFQPAWEDEYTALVLARDGGGGYGAYRCQVDRRKKRCAAVWSGDSGGRYSTWLVPRSTRPIEVARDEHRGFAMWPEHRGVDARRSCAAPEAWRADPHATAEEFGRRVLGWPDARAEIDRYEHFGVHVLLRRTDGPLIQMSLAPVVADCWSVTGVARAPDRREEGVSVSVRGRRVRVGVLSLGAVSADVIVGFNGREIRRVGDVSGATVRLDFKPRGSGYFLVLLKDSEGRVFSAAGALLYPGLVAG